MNCPKCGHVYQQEDAFCSACGYHFVPNELRHTETQNEEEKAKEFRTYNISQTPGTQANPKKADEDEIVFRRGLQQFDLVDEDNSENEDDDDIERRRTIPHRSSAKYTRDYTSTAEKVLKTFIFLLLAVCIGLGGYFAYRYFIGQPIEIKPTATPVYNVNAPTIAHIAGENGKMMYKLTFTATPGDRIYISSLDKYLDVASDGKAILEVYDEELIPADITMTDETITVELKPVLQPQNGSHQQIETPPLVVSIPVATFILVEPAGSNINTFDANITLKFKVVPGSKVVIDGTDYSNLVNDKGLGKITLPLEPIDNNSFDVRVEINKARVYTSTINVSRPQMPVLLTLSSSLATSTKADKITITGKTEAGAVLECDKTVDGTPFVNSDTGEFSITIKLNEYGTNHIVLSSTLQGKGTSKLGFYIERTAVLDEYTRKAWAFESNLLKNPEAFKGIIFVFYNARVERIEQTDELIMIADVGSEGKPALVAIRYNGSKTITESKIYKIYADVNGSYGEYPLLTARFLYNVD